MRVLQGNISVWINWKPPLGPPQPASAPPRTRHFRSVRITDSCQQQRSSPIDNLLTEREQACELELVAVCLGRQQSGTKGIRSIDLAWFIPVLRPKGSEHQCRLARTPGGSPPQCAANSPRCSSENTCAYRLEIHCLPSCVTRRYRSASPI